MISSAKIQLVSFERRQYNTFSHNIFMEFGTIFVNLSTTNWEFLLTKTC